MNYYFLAPSLPTLCVGEWPDLTYEELMHRLSLNLTKDDFEQVIELKRMIDLNNIRAFFLGTPIDFRGNLNEKELDDAILTESELPGYVFSFLKRFQTKEERMENLSFVWAEFFQEAIEQSKGFVKRYFTFEHEWRLVMTALRAQKLHRDVSEELKYEDPTHPVVAHLLAQQESPAFVVPDGYGDLVEKYHACGGDPWRHHEVFSKWRFERIGELAEGPLFAVDWVLAYLAQHLLVEEELRLSLEKGEELLRESVNG